MTLAPGVSLSDEDLTAVCRRYHVKELSVFGSAARGELRPESDIDLLVEFLPGAPVGLFELWEMAEAMETALGRKVDLVPKGGLRPMIRPSVLKDSRLLYAA